MLQLPNDNVISAAIVGASVFVFGLYLRAHIMWRAEETLSRWQRAIVWLIDFVGSATNRVLDAVLTAIAMALVTTHGWLDFIIVFLSKWLR